MKLRFSSLLLAVVLMMVSIAVPLASSSVAAENAVDPFVNVNIPPDLGQSAMQVYVPETGHTLRGYFLDYWRANGGASVFGNPISEPFASSDGYYSQAFENGIFQFVLELIWTDLPSVTLMPIGSAALDSRVDTFRADGRRGFGGGDRRSSTWKPVSPEGVTALTAVSTGGVWSEITGHTMSGPVYDWYAAHEGTYYLGEPISQPLTERGRVVQYFEGGLLELDSFGRVRMAPLAREVAPAMGIDTTPVDGSGMMVYNDALFYPAGLMGLGTNLDAPGKRWIEINIPEQRLYAYQGSTLVASTLISTGLTPNETEVGTFHVRYKLEKQDMIGTTDETGAVVALGEDAAKDAQSGAVQNQDAYVVKDVPNVMYINQEAEALHGAYWHNNFGNPMSHGCVNLPLDFAQFLYAWAPLGTMVWVHK